MNADQILQQIAYLVDKNFAPNETGRKTFHIGLLCHQIRELVAHVHVLEEHIKQIKQTYTEH